jgi:hypothetical protein
MFLIVTGGSLMPSTQEPSHGRGADAAGEIGEIVGLVQAVERFVPQAAINQVVPLRDQVVDGAARGHAAEQRAGVAKRNAAIHAARALLAQFLLVQVKMEFVPVADALQGGRSSGNSRKYSMNPVGLPMSCGKGQRSMADSPIS